VREDVGRHNALDKLVGALLRERLPGPEGFVVITSRASYEMVGKTARPAWRCWRRCQASPAWPLTPPQPRVWRWPALRAAQDLTLYAHEER
jgi:hypothetical protein